MTAEDLTTLSPAQLNKFTKAELIAAIVEEQWIDASLPIERDEYGNAIRQLQRTKDAYGEIVEEKIIRWTYYDAKEGTVDEITVEDDKERLVVKHFTDGRQPVGSKSLIKPVPMER